MTSIIANGPKPFASDSGHWYTKTGDPMYDIIGANGKKRATRITDARKLDLVPSVSTIMKLEAKPQLTNWLVQQGMLACLTLPRLSGEDDTSFIRRALDDSKQQVIRAAERGTYLHGLLEESLVVGEVTCRATDEDCGYVRPVLDWIEANFPGYTWSPESSFAVNVQGKWFGGKRDVTGTHPINRPVVMDYKCKNFKRGTEKVLAYAEHVTQLAAYGFPFDKEFTAVNIFVSTTDPGAFIPVNWAQPEIGKGWDAFQALLSLWYARHDL